MENKETFTNNEIMVNLDSRTLEENLDSGIKIMGIGMSAVFGVLIILYIAIKIMGRFAKTEKKEEK